MIRLSLCTPAVEPLRIRIALTVLLAAAIFGQQTDAQQSLTDSLFARYLEALREEAAIPGMSGLVLQQGNIVWERNFGRQDVESALVPRSDTPYLIGGMSQIFGSALLLKKCVEEQVRDLNEPVTNWIPDFSDPSATLLYLAAHVQSNGSYKYDAARFSMLTPVVEACASEPYPHLIADEVFSQFAMTSSVPGTALAAPDANDMTMFDAATLAHYRDVLSRLATPYAVDTAGRATRSEVPRQRVNAFTGVVTSVNDLAHFDRALDRLLLQAATRQAALTQVAGHLPTGLGWFVQTYNGERVAWQFGMVPDAYSSLIVKVPGKELTFVLLANSDGLSAPFALERGDVTASLFARTFLRLYVP